MDFMSKIYPIDKTEKYYLFALHGLNFMIVNVDTGAGAGPVNLRSVVYLGIDVFTPCPYCGQGCTAPVINVG